MAVVLNAIQSVLTILIMIFLGYILAKKGWFDEKASFLFSKIVINVALPASMLYSLLTSFNKESLFQLGKGILLPFLIIIISYALSMVIAVPLKISSYRKGVFYGLFAFSNTIFIGLPVNQALFGDKAIPYVLLFYIGNTTLFWTLGVYMISRDGSSENRAADKKKILSYSVLKRVFSPALFGFIIAVILILLNIQLPLFIMNTCKYVGNLTTPLSMFFTGMVIYSMNLSKIKLDFQMIALLIGRFIAAPLIAFSLIYHFPVDVMMKKVFIIQSSLPVMVNISIVAKEYKGDYNYAAVMVTLTTAASLITIPLYMYLMSMIW